MSTATQRHRLGTPFALTALLLAAVGCGEEQPAPPVVPAGPQLLVVTFNSGTTAWPRSRRTARRRLRQRSGRAVGHCGTATDSRLRPWCRTPLCSSQNCSRTSSHSRRSSISEECPNIPAEAYLGLRVRQLATRRSQRGSARPGRRLPGGLSPWQIRQVPGGAARAWEAVRKAAPATSAATTSTAPPCPTAAADRALAAASSSWLDGGTLTVVGVHGSSGLTQEDQDCRVKQFAQVFEDLGDGSNAACRQRRAQHRARRPQHRSRPQRRLRRERPEVERACRAQPRASATSPNIGPDATPSYGAFFNIDHVASDAFRRQLPDQPASAPSTAPVSQHHVLRPQTHRVQPPAAGRRPVAAAPGNAGASCSVARSRPAFAPWPRGLRRVIFAGHAMQRRATWAHRAADWRRRRSAACLLDRSGVAPGCR